MKEHLKKVLQLPAKSTRIEFKKTHEGLDGLRESIGSFEAEARSAARAYEGLSDDVRAALALADRSAADIQSRFDVVEAMEADCAQILAAQGSTLGVVRESVSVVHEDAERALKALDERMQAIERQLRAAAMDGGSVKSTVSGLGSRLWANERSSVMAVAATMPRQFIEHLDYHVVDHCNLNCVCCSTYSPIAKERFADISQFGDDLRLLKSIVGDSVLRLHLLGGEPLLHPEIEGFLVVAREIFSSARIDVTSNGVLVSKMPDSFWEVMKQCDIDLKYTRYPINLDYGAMVKRARERGVLAYSAGDEIRCFRRIPLNPRGTSNVHQTYLRCPYIDCPQLREGRLYRCPTSAYSDILNDAMAASEHIARFKLNAADYLELHESLSAQDVFGFLSRPIPFCQYCDMGKVDNAVPWGHSSREITEWVDL